ncbi:Cilia- and flagella-associated protein 43 [Physocladia obscura]|uniref:Cilia- and flagella-associated protein 43 n=1 Tax=Physocladia obscura TaxID=109957 RepID=A0AAD5T9R2_9FUNG|nr:Cilia- and flagella-associated protein 43 [Physocladia obscura]
MPQTLFGDLEVGRSFGLMPISAPKYISQNILVYVSGNALNFVGGSKSAIKPITANAQITATAVCRKESLIAYSERGSADVIVIKFPLATIIGDLKPDNRGTDIGVVSLEFSHDNKFLASLSDLPSYRITIWDWKKNLAIAYIDTMTPAKSISFNPLNSTKLCTSGGGEFGSINFWKFEMGFKANSLKLIMGRECYLDEPTPSLQSLKSNATNDINLSAAETHILLTATPAPLIPAANHTWQQTQHVLVTTESGDAILQFNSTTGDGHVLFSAWRTRYEVEKQRAKNNRVSFHVNSENRDEGEKLDQEVADDKVNEYVRTEYGGTNNFRAILVTENAIISGGADGIVRFLDYDGEVKMQVPLKKIAQPKNELDNRNLTPSILTMAFSPDFQDIAITTTDHHVHILNIPSMSVTQDFITIESENVVGMALFPVSDVVVTAHKTAPFLKFWDPDSKRISKKINHIGGDITVVATNPLSSILAVGTATGIVRVYDVAFQTSDEPRLLMRERVTTLAVEKLLFDPTGRFLVAFGAEKFATFIDMSQKCTIIGLLQCTTNIIQVFWESEDSEDELDDESRSVARYLFKEIVTDFVVAGGLSSPKSFYTVCGRKIKSFNRVNKSQEVSGEVINVGDPISEFHDHQKKGTKLALSLSAEWLFSYSPDGYIVARNFLDPEKCTKVFAHDSILGGVSQLAISRDAHNLFSAGYDSILRIYEWKSTMASTRRALIEAAEAAEIMIGTKMEKIKVIVESLKNTPTHEYDPEDSVNELCYFVKNIASENKATDANTSLETSASTSEAYQKIASIRHRLIKLMEQNESVPDLEKMAKHEFILDFAERDRLNVEADAQVLAVRKEIELENLKKRVIKNRIKAECWDSMEVIGAVIKSFRPDPNTTRIIQVPNYPIKKKSVEEIKKIDKVKLLRKIQLHFDIASQRKDAPAKLTVVPAEDILIDSAATEAPLVLLDEEPSFSSVKSLLYDDFELTTNERKRTQIILLQEAVEFNSTFKEIIKMKKDEIIKIDDKNERICNITAELQQTPGATAVATTNIEELAIFRPQLDEDEVPERIIQVDDSEVKAEKQFIGPEELRKIEEKKREDEERRRAAQEDNYRERGLMMMMGGTLDDKSEETEKEELVKPEWMNKSREEMNEEERKLVKEFEKKLATMKEEQEKYRKALETELKKLQGFIVELCDNFDGKLRELLIKKLEADQEIYKNELKRIKLQQSILLAENDETKECRLNMRLEDLKAEKMNSLQYLPEIKKELERLRDEYDTATKKDKDMDKLFKKEFSTMDPMFDACYKLFKKRETKAADQTSESEQPELASIIETNSSVDPLEIPSYIPLNPEVDFIEGLSQEAWVKIVDLRERKIATEFEARIANAAYTEFQAISQTVSEENDRIRKETDRVVNDLAAFAEYRFHTTYNQEKLFELKQGQVEVPQAPVVTDYSDAGLIHRGVVEKLNESIVSLGNTKVDALKEMKEYRKGIHALEWENKMLDFQAEDLVIRTRDIQLLRVTKNMQEYIRGGDERKQSNEIIALEKRAEHNSKSHLHKLEERNTQNEKYLKKIAEKKRENDVLEARLRELEISVKERKKIHEVSVKKNTGGTNSGGSTVLSDIYTRRKLVDLAKSQAQDIAILREEVERLRLRTYPAFPSKQNHNISAT